MTIYIGYISAEYELAVFMSTNKKKVKEEMKQIHKDTECDTYVRGYKIKEDELIELG